jgi:hypothetical protein
VVQSEHMRALHRGLTHIYVCGYMCAGGGQDDCRWRLKMRKRNGLVLGVAMIVVPGIALACQFDTDCSPGSNCLKNHGQIKGVCLR